MQYAIQNLIIIIILLTLTLTVSNYIIAFYSHHAPIAMHLAILVILIVQVLEPREKLFTRHTHTL